MDLPTAVSTAGLVNNVISVLRNARELAKDASDAELKEKISEAYDALLDLKERALALDEENRNLKAQLSARVAYVGPISPHGYYYAASDEGKEHPLCPKCYQSVPQIVGFISDAEPWYGAMRRVCKLGDHSIVE